MNESFWLTSRRNGVGTGVGQCRANDVAAYELFIQPDQPKIPIPQNRVVFGEEEEKNWPRFWDMDAETSRSSVCLASSTVRRKGSMVGSNSLELQLTEYITLTSSDSSQLNSCRGREIFCRAKQTHNGPGTKHHEEGLIRPAPART